MPLEIGSLTVEGGIALNICDAANVDTSRIAIAKVWTLTGTIGTAKATVDGGKGGSFTLSEHRGQVVFINLWATSCTPCKHELPYFSDLYVAHEGDIAMLVVHSSMVMDDPEAYLADKGYAMPFATDDDDDPDNQKDFFEKAEQGL